MFGTPRNKEIQISAESLAYKFKVSNTKDHFEELSEVKSRPPNIKTEIMEGSLKKYMTMKSSTSTGTLPRYAQPRVADIKR